jgi:hypothetical protein
VTATNAAAPGTPVYDTPQWRYLFDNEIETLRTPSTGRGQPVGVRLRLERRGAWWFGFRESHRVRVTAVPVTDKTNGGKAGNAVDLTAVRWRLIPFPALLLVPILLVMMVFLSGSAKTLDVLNAAQGADDGQYWVVNPPGVQKQLTLQWQAPPLAVLRLTGLSGDQQILSKPEFGSGGFTQQVAVSDEDRRVTNVYRVSRYVGGGDRDAVVSFIFTRNDTPLLVMDGDTKHPLTSNNIDLTVPYTGYARLDLTNVSMQSTRIDWWLITSLDSDDPFTFLYVKNSGSIEQGGTEHLLIQRNPSGPQNVSDRIVFVTTDSNRSVITVNLNPGPQEGH